MIRENTTKPCSKIPNTNNTALPQPFRLYALVKYLIINSMRMSPSIEWPLGHPN